MTTDWTELTTLQDVAKAQADGWEIETKLQGREWTAWFGNEWNTDREFRARPRQPKMKTVKMLAYLDARAELRWMADEPASSGWTRIPAQDIEIEIPEGV